MNSQAKTHKTHKGEAEKSVSEFLSFGSFPAWKFWLCFGLASLAGLWFVIRAHGGTTFTAEFHGAGEVHMGATPTNLTAEAWDTNVYSSNVAGYDERPGGMTYFYTTNGVTLSVAATPPSPVLPNPLLETFSTNALRWLNTVKMKIAADLLSAQLP